MFMFTAQVQRFSWCPGVRLPGTFIYAEEDHEYFRLFFPGQDVKNSSLPCTVFTPRTGCPTYDKRFFLCLCCIQYGNLASSSSSAFQSFSSERSRFVPKSNSSPYVMIFGFSWAFFSLNTVRNSQLKRANRNNRLWYSAYVLSVFHSRGDEQSQMTFPLLTLNSGDWTVCLRISIVAFGERLTIERVVKYSKLMPAALHPPKKSLASESRSTPSHELEYQTIPDFLCFYYF